MPIGCTKPCTGRASEELGDRDNRTVLHTGKHANTINYFLNKTGNINRNEANTFLPFVPCYNVIYTRPLGKVVGLATQRGALTEWYFDGTSLQFGRIRNFLLRAIA